MLYSSRLTVATLPRMGERFRLRQDFDVTGFSPQVRAILKGLKEYGLFVADKGIDWRLSVAPDRRIRGLTELRRLKGSDFEVVQTTEPNEGPWCNDVGHNQPPQRAPCKRAATPLT
jgi:hypothetical protein